MRSKAKKRGRFTPTYIPTPQVYEKVEIGEDGVVHHQMAVRHLPVPRYKTRRREGSSYASAFLVDGGAPPRVETWLEFVRPVVCNICKQGPGVHQECLRRMAMVKMQARFHG